MPRYFFDIHDGGIAHDGVGCQLPDVTAARKTAMNSLPRIAAEEIAADGDRKNFVVVARDESGRPVYTATLSYVGLTLVEPENA